jgi:nucleoside phosphorylase
MLFMNLVTNSEIFLNYFPAMYRSHIIQFAKNIANLDVDIILLTARKSLCFFSALNTLELFVPKDKIIISERWAEHDLAWVKDKKIAIVDEVIISGSSISKLYKDLEKAKPASISIYCMFINETWFANNLFENINLVRNYISLKEGDAQALSSAIVDAFKVIPRPYNTDYPMSMWSAVEGESIKTIFNIYGWFSTLINDNEIKEGGFLTAYYTLTPYSVYLEKISELIGVDSNVLALVKIRIYARNHNFNKTERMEFRIVPYIILKGMSVESLNKIFNNIVFLLNDSDKITINRVCSSASAKLRLIHFVLSLRLASVWYGQVKDNGVDISFKVDTTELGYLFPIEIHDLIFELQKKKNKKLTDFEIDFKPSIQISKNNKNLTGFDRLTNIFLDLYVEKEIPHRYKVKELEKSQKKSFLYDEILSRLKNGYSIDDLVLMMSNEYNNEDAAFVVSFFLDIYIDKGIVVPVTTLTETSKNEKSYIGRSFRHGEETYILHRDFLLFEIMLKNLAEHSDQKNINKLTMEKILVLFFKYCYGEGIIRYKPDSLCRASNIYTKLSVRYHIYGAVLSTSDSDLPLSFDSQLMLTNRLVEKGVLKLGKEYGYVINENGVDVNIEANSADDSVDESKKSTVTQFSMTVGHVLDSLEEIHRFYQQDDNNEKLSYPKFRDNFLVSITTCESAQSSLMACGAELRLFCESFSYGFDINKRVLLEKLNKNNNLHVYFDSAFNKINFYLSDDAAKFKNLVYSFFRVNSKDKISFLFAEMWQVIMHKYKVNMPQESEIFADALLCDIFGLINEIEVALWLLENSLLLSSPDYDANRVSYDARINHNLESVDKYLLRCTSSDFDFSKKQSGDKFFNSLKNSSLKIYEIKSKNSCLDATKSTDFLVRILNNYLDLSKSYVGKINDSFKDFGRAPEASVFRNYMIILVPTVDNNNLDVFDSWLNNLNVRSNKGEKAVNYKSSQNNTDDPLFISIENQYIYRVYKIYKLKDAAVWFSSIVVRMYKYYVQNKFRFKWLIMTGLGDDIAPSKTNICPHVRSLRALDELSANEVSLMDNMSGAVYFVNSDLNHSDSFSRFDSFLNNDLRSAAPSKIKDVKSFSQIAGDIRVDTYQISNLPVQPKKILLLTATKIEYETVCRKLNDISPIEEKFDHSFAGKKCILTNENVGAIEIYVTLASEQGATEMATITTKYISTIDPVAVVIVGMCMGIKGRAKFKDVLVPTEIFSYHHQTIQGGKVIFRPHPYRPNKNSNRRIDNLDPDGVLKGINIIKKGFATASSKIEDPDAKLIKTIMNTSPDIVGYEMELGGFFNALQEHPSLEHLAVKAVADTGDFSHRDGKTTEEQKEEKVKTQSEATEAALKVALAWINHLVSFPISAA